MQPSVSLPKSMTSSHTTVLEEKDEDIHPWRCWVGHHSEIGSILRSPEKARIIGFNVSCFGVCMWQKTTPAHAKRSLSKTHMLHIFLWEKYKSPMELCVQESLTKEISWKDLSSYRLCSIYREDVHRTFQEPLSIEKHSLTFHKSLEICGTKSSLYILGSYSQNQSKLDSLLPLVLLLWFLCCFINGKKKHPSLFLIKGQLLSIGL